MRGRRRIAASRHRPVAALAAVGCTAQSPPLRPPKPDSAVFGPQGRRIEGSSAPSFIVSSRSSRPLCSSFPQGLRGPFAHRFLKVVEVFESKKSESFGLTSPRPLGEKPSLRVDAVSTPRGWVGGSKGREGCGGTLFIFIFFLFFFYTPEIIELLHFTSLGTQTRLRQFFL